MTPQFLILIPADSNSEYLVEGAHGVGAVGGRDHVRLVRDAVLGHLRVHRPGKQALKKDIFIRGHSKSTSTGWGYAHERT